MNKKILRSCAVMVIAVVAAYNVYLGNSSESAMSDVSLANVEALADDESGSCSGGCKDIGWGASQILKCNCSYTGYFSSCNSWGCN
ncbi:MAG: NVEALA domain-containing protein [Dysgonamonadaceae bacterium]|jgi:1,4-dihydroxy-2-naphthoyl-CoA synthase|nr:NVEALA domain-containing protein [Dysgonamonadaceae bacterium]